MVCTALGSHHLLGVAHGNGTGLQAAAGAPDQAGRFPPGVTRDPRGRGEIHRLYGAMEAGKTTGIAARERS